MKIYLIGFMASGKSTIGQELAKALGYDFIDMDIFIENKYGRSIKQIFEIDGESKFRELENSVLREVAALEGNFVIASGGGTSCFYNSVDFMNKTGFTVYLRMEVAQLVSRLIDSKTDRPLLWGKTKEELTGYILKVLEERKKYYEKARLIVDAANLDIPHFAQTIISAIE